jgi:plasmid stabilization system protein ParE
LEFFAIVDYFIDEGFPEFAEIFVSQLEKTLALIKTYPYGFDQPFSDINARRANVGRYAIFFTVNDATKEIILLHILHSRRDIEQILS